MFFGLRTRIGFFVDLGSVLEPQMTPTWAPRATQDLLRTSPAPPKKSKSAQERSEPPKTVPRHLKKGRFRVTLFIPFTSYLHGGGGLGSFPKFCSTAIRDAMGGGIILATSWYHVFSDPRCARDGVSTLGITPCSHTHLQFRRPPCHKS